MLRSQAGGSTPPEVSSVDGFQGKEKEVIVFSAVRANSSGSVGFLADWRCPSITDWRQIYGSRLETDRQTRIYGSMDRWTLRAI